MASRSGAGPGRHPAHPNPARDAEDDFPPLPLPRFPSLRTSSGELQPSRPASPSRPSANANAATVAAGPGGLNGRPPTRYWSAAARRAERIRNLDDRDRAPSLDDLESNSVDPSWSSTSGRRHPRLRPLDSASHHRRPNLDELDQTLDEANSQLRTLLEMTNHINLMTPFVRSTLSPTIRPHDFSDDNLPTKRRKIDSNRLVPSFKGFRYGKYGQVEPGHLQMEIVSCDGGMFSNESSYAAENILKDDSSVYCTKGNRCNIVLRHQGATVFTLEELIIKAPASMNYSHPVREGMVFIAMNQDDILSRTAQYQIQYVPSNRVTYDDHTTRHSLARDPTPRHIVSIRHHHDGTTSTRVRRSVYPSLSRSHDNDEHDHRTPEMPDEFSANQPDFRITTECTSDEEDYSAPHNLRRTPNRIGFLPFETETSDSEEGPFTDDFTESFHRQIHPPSASSTSHPSHPVRPRTERLSVSLAEAWDAHATATQEAIRAVGGELLVPHAKFFIEKKKSKCTIRFDPPVSGRFILLKMWSSHHDVAGNIDIQSVMAKGYAGPRYFPSVELS
ncbi:uncharacterized protein MAM_01540 [Metarhizium album ARSEF 1941]|uniref:Eukaryotic translation initiation factor 6 n=1 Tax=Metarhizium album (strain ARSEF 1941) TaxID=1081103 RepID=A0A0B2WX34_METAS|nr:uncharacterized protein MAM_01540 [Metarhizium album ARSEF 1941]KHO00762.1 hypothetical protein MAM_01540 [Metarhizium album ARSEF 1941]